jgi:hypothetical protein
VFWTLSDESDSGKSETQFLSQAETSKVLIHQPVVGRYNVSDKWEDMNTQLLVDEARKKKPPDKKRKRHSSPNTEWEKERIARDASLIIEQNRPPDKKEAGKKGKRRGQEEVP